jgi:hypothetical protein
MNESKPALSAETTGTEITRFNALRHGVLSRYTVLPWEDSDECEAAVASLVAEHQPQGPTEEHLVEELGGVLWRKRRLRLAEAAAHRRGLKARSPTIDTPRRQRWLTSQRRISPRMSARRSALRHRTPKRSCATSPKPRQ